MKKKPRNSPTSHQIGLDEPAKDASEGLIVKKKTIRVLLDTGSRGNLLFIRKGSQKYIPYDKGCTTIVGHFQWHLSNQKWVISTYLLQSTP